MPKMLPGEIESPAPSSDGLELILMHNGITVYWYDEIYYVHAGWLDAAHQKPQLCFFKPKASSSKASMHYRRWNDDSEDIPVLPSKISNVKYWVDALQYRYGERYDVDNKGKKGSDGGNLRRVRKKVMKAVLALAEEEQLDGEGIDVSHHDTC